VKYVSIIALLVILLTGCADKVDLSACEPETIYGFWYGLWHGAIVVISFICSLFCDDVAIYAIHNSGGWYNFGFILGISLTVGSGSKASN
jgi:hypothetical protein